MRRGVGGGGRRDIGPCQDTRIWTSTTGPPSCRPTVCSVLRRGCAHTWTRTGIVSAGGEMRPLCRCTLSYCPLAGAATARTEPATLLRWWGRLAPPPERVSLLQPAGRRRFEAEAMAGDYSKHEGRVLNWPNAGSRGPTEPATETASSVESMACRDIRGTVHPAVVPGWMATDPTTRRHHPTLDSAQS